MVKRNLNMGDNEPDQKQFDLPSQKEHTFQITDIFTNQDNIGQKLGLDENTVSVKCEVIGGDEEGRTLLNRCSLDDKYKGFFATKLFLKAIGEAYKGDNISIDTDNWVGKQFTATVVHNKGYANIKEYNFDKSPASVQAPATPADIPGWEE